MDPITSKYFHSGIALDEHVTPGMPPRLKPENTTLPEIMKRGGYTTGVIASHEYWNDWGMDQGVDDFDNSFQRLKLDRGPHRIEIRLSNYQSLSVDVMIQEDFTITYRGELAKQ